jgi:hypothetical protein
MNRRLLLGEAKNLRSEIQGISKRVGKGHVTEADARAAESKAALAELFEATANSSEAIRDTFEQHGGQAGSRGQWESFGHYLQAVHRAADPRLTSGPDPRLETRSASGLGTICARRRRLPGPEPILAGAHEVDRLPVGTSATLPECAGDDRQRNKVPRDGRAIEGLWFSLGRNLEYLVERGRGNHRVQSEVSRSQSDARKALFAVPVKVDQVRYLFL